MEISIKMEWKTHKMNLQDTWFKYIKSGDKIYEGRIFDDTRKELKIFDRIIFKNNNTGEEIKKIIIGLIYYNSFKDMISNTPLNELLPGITYEDAIEIYHAIPGYKERAYMNGVIAIKLQ